MKQFFDLIRNMKIQMLCLLAILFITALLKQESEQYSTLIMQVGTSILIAIFAEFAFFGAVKTTSVQSAVITGTIIAFLLAPGINFKILWFAVTVAIASKKLFQFPSGAHIFNPAASGLLMTTLFFGNRINWWGFSSPYIVIILGGIILFRLNRLSFVFSYIIFRCLGVTFFNGFNFNIDMLMLPNFFFAFIMLVEPKTTPYKRIQQWQFGAGTGLLASLFFSIIPAFGGALIALLCMNLIRPILPTSTKNFISRNGKK